MLRIFLIPIFKNLFYKKICKIIHKKFWEYASNFQSYKKVCSSSLILRENKVACFYLTSVFSLVLCLRLWHNHTQMEHLKVTFD